MRSIFETALEYTLSNPGIVDLVVWFPRLDWEEFAVAAAAVLTWNWISERIWKAVKWLTLNYGWYLVKFIARALLTLVTTR